MAGAGAPDDGVNAFLVGEDVLFSHYFDEGDVFGALKPYYNNQQYRFEVPIARFPNVLDVLVRHGYAVTYRGDASAFVVAVKQYSQHPENIFKESVDHRSVDDWNCFLLRSRAAVDRAVRTHARPIENAPVANPFAFAVRTDGIERRPDRRIRRLSLAASPGALAERFDASVADESSGSYNLGPGDRLATVTAERPGTVDRYHWGLVPFWADGPDDQEGPLTVPADTIDEAPLVAEAFQHRRCLVLVDGVYVWEADEGSSDGSVDEDAVADARDVERDERSGGDSDPAAGDQLDIQASTAAAAAADRPPRPYRLATRDEEPFAVAGVWEVWAAGDDVYRSVALVTREATPALREVTDRQPVVLDANGRSTWLDADDADAARDLLTAEPAVALRHYPVSRAVLDPATDEPGLADPVDASTQVGLDAFAGAANGDSDGDGIADGAGGDGDDGADATGGADGQ